MDSSCIQSESVILKGEYHWKTIPSVGVHTGLFIYYLKGLKVICSASISMPCCMLYGSFIIMVVPQWKFKHWRFIVYVVVNSMNAHVQSWIMKVLKCLINLWLILVTNLISLKIICDWHEVHKLKEGYGLQTEKSALFISHLHTDSSVQGQSSD